MKKFDESNNNSSNSNNRSSQPEDSTTTLAAYGLRRLNIRPVPAAPVASGTSGIATMTRPRPSVQNGKILDSWHSAEDKAGATYFWNPEDVLMTRAKNDISSSRNIRSGIGATYGTTVVPSNSGATAQRPQKIVPSGYAPNRFPVSVSYTPRPCWPKTYSYANSNYHHMSSATANSIPVTRITSGQAGIASQQTPSTSTLPFSPSSSSSSASATERIIYPKQSSIPPGNGTSTGTSATLPNGLPRRFENGTNGTACLPPSSEREKSRRIGLGNGFFHRKLSFSKHNTVKGASGDIPAGRQSEILERRKQRFDGAAAGNYGASNKREALLIWSVPGKKADLKNARNGKGGGKKSSKSASSERGKPRMPKFLKSFCCCIRPEASIKAKQRTLQPAPSTSSPQSLITQVTKNSQNGTSVNGTNISGSDGSYAVDDDDTGEYVPMQPLAENNLLLPPVRPCDGGKKCLIIDLDETLVHSSFKPVKNPDFVIPVEIDNVIHQVYVLKRPYVDEFLERIGDKFECVLFTASLAKYADPVADFLDKRGVFRARLFRESCVFHKGNYVKDLTRLGRDLKKVIIVDNSPASYAFHPDNAIPVQTWFDDANDVELLDIIPVLEQLAEVDSIYTVLRNSNDDMRRSISSEQNETSRSS